MSPLAARLLCVHMNTHMYVMIFIGESEKDIHRESGGKEGFRIKEE